MCDNEVFEINGFEHLTVNIKKIGGANKNSGANTRRQAKYFVKFYSKIIIQIPYGFYLLGLHITFCPLHLKWLAPPTAPNVKVYTLQSFRNEEMIASLNKEEHIFYGET